ncbi:MAG: GNAT family N-acetyltransferase [Asgard group archaeon]|nr:GNAT family N-acetyltransferase [Asgard group archaeon]
MINRKTDRLIIRNFTSEDLEDMLEISQQYEKTEMAQYDQQFPQTAEGMKEVMEFISCGDSFAAVELKTIPKVIGLLQFQRKDKITDAIVHGFGYIFNSDYQGKGYATEACKDILTYLFDELKINKTTAGTAEANISSRKLLEKLGFKEVNQKRTHFRKDAEGKPIEFNSIIYELTANDWLDFHK